MARRPWTAKACLALTCLALGLSLLTGCGGGQGGANLPEKPANGAVLDVAGVLTDETVARILDQNKALAPVGAQITVVTVDVLGGKSAGEYAAGLWDSWALDGEHKNGVLVLLAVGEGQYHLLQGSAIASDLTDQTLADCAWTYLEHDFASGDYDAGVRKLCDGLSAWYRGHYAKELGLAQDEEVPDSGQSGGFPWLVIVLAVAVVAVIALLVFKLRQSGQSGSAKRSRRRYQGRRRR